MHNGKMRLLFRHAENVAVSGRYFAYSFHVVIGKNAFLAQKLLADSPQHNVTHAVACGSDFRNFSHSHVGKTRFSRYVAMTAS